ncbi:MAG TPA: hypothetical protein VFE46_14970 [Pirellulales bacterium]|nr:hypothetical protein [Pirellulales bacterium]
MITVRAVCRHASWFPAYFAVRRKLTACQQLTTYLHRYDFLSQGAWFRKLFAFGKLADAQSRNSRCGKQNRSPFVLGPDDGPRDFSTVLHPSPDKTNSFWRRKKFPHFVYKNYDRFWAMHGQIC